MKPFSGRDSQICRCIGHSLVSLLVITFLGIAETQGQLTPELRAGVISGSATLRADAAACCPISSTSLLTSLFLGAGLGYDVSTSLLIYAQLDVRTTWRSATASEHTIILNPTTSPPSTLPARFDHLVGLVSFAPGIDVGGGYTWNNIVFRAGASSRWYAVPSTSSQSRLVTDNSHAIVLNGFDGVQAWNTRRIDGHVWSIWSDISIPVPFVLENQNVHIVAGIELPVIDTRQYLVTQGPQVRLGLAYTWPSHPPALPNVDGLTPAAPVSDSTFITELPDFSVDLPGLMLQQRLRLVALQGRHPDTLYVETEETETHDHLPILPVLFFDEGSFTIPSRFRSAISAWITRRGDVDVATAARASLAIIAERLKQDTNNVLRIVGTTSSYGADTGLALARQRSEAVRNEFVQLGVKPRQLVIETTLTPRHPTVAADPADAPFAHEENQRVDLVAHDDVFEPVLVRRIVHESSDGVLAALLENEPSDLRPTRLTLTTGQQLLAERSDPRQLPNETRFPVDVFHNLPHGIHTLVGITSERGKRGASDSVTVIRRHKKRVHRDVIGGRIVDRVRLIVFSYDETVIRGANLRRIKTLRSEISSTDSIRIIGRTDNIGASAYNIEVSRRRAIETSRALGVVHADIIASGEGVETDHRIPSRRGINDVDPTTGRFSDRTPEGRMYNRTVIIERILR